MVKLKLKTLLYAKIRGTTLLESLVAMVVVLLSFGIALMIYVNVTSSNNSQQRLNAYLTLNEALYTTIEDQSFIDEEYKEGSINIIKTVQPLGRANGLMEVHLVAKDLTGKTLSEVSKIVAK